MIILTIRTDKPEAEVGLFDNEHTLGYTKWQAHRELSATIHHKIEALLRPAQKTWSDLEGIVAFRGPGSFTGLRIGLSVANALSYALQLPIVASGDPDWIKNGCVRLIKGDNEQLALPEYGAPVHITEPKH